MLKGSLLNKTDLKLLGNHIKTVRQFKGYSRNELSRLSNVSESVIKRIENSSNSTMLRPQTLLKLFESLESNIEIEYTFKIKQEKDDIKC